MKMLKKRKGFTLVELIAVVAVLSLVMVICGVTVAKIINNSKEKSLAITESSILAAAKVYVEENVNGILWTNGSIDGIISTTNEEYTCITTQELINKGLLKNSIKDKINNTNMIAIWKDENGVLNDTT